MWKKQLEREREHKTVDCLTQWCSLWIGPWHAQFHQNNSLFNNRNSQGQVTTHIEIQIGTTWRDVQHVESRWVFTHAMPVSFMSFCIPYMPLYLLDFPFWFHLLYFLPFPQVPRLTSLKITAREKQVFFFAHTKQGSLAQLQLDTHFCLLGIFRAAVNTPHTLDWASYGDERQRHTHTHTFSHTHTCALRAALGGCVWTWAGTLSAE